MTLLILQTEPKIKELNSKSCVLFLSYISSGSNNIRESSEI